MKILWSAVSHRTTIQTTNDDCCVSLYAARASTRHDYSHMTSASSQVAELLYFIGKWLSKFRS